MGRPPDCNCNCDIYVDPPPPEFPPLGSCPAIAHLISEYCPGWYEQFNPITGDPDKFLAIQFCNTNFAKDDDVSVYLNGSLIDPYLNLTANAPVGAIYLSNGTSISDNDPLLRCPGEGHKQVSFSPTLLRIDQTENVVSTSLESSNDAGNQGTVRIIAYNYPYSPGVGCIVEQQPYFDPPSPIRFDLCEKAVEVRLRISKNDYSGDEWPASQIQIEINNSSEFLYNIVEGPGSTFYATPGQSVRFEMTYDGRSAPSSSNIWYVRLEGGDWISTGVSTQFPLQYTIPSVNFEVVPSKDRIYS
jgi:hypothetical protein